jgi:hypothetical protein
MKARLSSKDEFESQVVHDYTCLMLLITSVLISLACIVMPVLAIVSWLLEQL